MRKVNITRREELEAVSLEFSPTVDAVQVERINRETVGSFTQPLFIYPQLKSSLL